MFHKVVAWLKAYRSSELFVMTELWLLRILFPFSICAAVLIVYFHSVFRHGRFYFDAWLAFFTAIVAIPMFVLTALGVQDLKIYRSTAVKRDDSMRWTLLIGGFWVGAITIVFYMAT